MKFDEIEIEFAQNGLVKISTGKVSAANHSDAEAALRYLQGLLGGEVDIARKAGHVHGHHHHHTHEHSHEGGNK
jgi:hypothetical protein